MSKFDLKDSLDKALFYTYNIASDFIFSFKFKSKRILKKNLQYKNTHTGKDCYILGTGPSLSKLSESEMKHLSQSVTFGVNSFYKSPIAKIIRPQYYALMDNLYWMEWSHTFSDILKLYPDSPPTFITDLRSKPILDSLNIKANPLYIHAKKYPTHQMSSELDQNIFGAMNVVSFSILAAMYMGFKNIYVLGCDYNAFCQGGSGHCYDDKDELTQSNYNLAFYLKFYWITTEFHYLIAKLAKASGVNVINLTPNSLLDAYPRASFESVLTSTQVSPT